MTEVKEEKKDKHFVVVGSASLLAKYKLSEKVLTVHLTSGETFKGTIRWYDDYSFKIFLVDNSGSITIPIHNVLYYECETFLLENEKDGKISSRVFRGVPKSNDRERLQLTKYKSNNQLLSFHLENDLEIKGRLNWFMDHVYSVRSEDKKHYQLMKRHIKYYRKLRPEKPARTHEGNIKMINTEKGFGFIIFDGGDIFFHRSEVIDSWEGLEPGQAVKFGVKDGQKGKVAVNIKVE